MPTTLNPELSRALADRIRYYNELGIYDFYRRGIIQCNRKFGRRRSRIPIAPQPELREEMSPKKSAVACQARRRRHLRNRDPKARAGRHRSRCRVCKLIREDLGDCTRCKLHKQGRKQIVFGVGNPQADLMFVGEGPGADEDMQGEPFVGRAGQLLNNMIKAMGIRREDVYIANVVKCRPPGNRTPERDECETCSPFLMRQIAVIKPKVVVAWAPSQPRLCLPSTHPCPNCADVSTTSCLPAHAAAIRLLGLARRKTRRHLSSRISAARSAPERRSLEGPADGDEVSGPEPPQKSE